MADGELNVDSLITRLLEGECGAAGGEGEGRLAKASRPSAAETQGTPPPPRPEVAAVEGRRGGLAGGTASGSAARGRLGERRCRRGGTGRAGGQCPRGPSGTPTAARRPGVRGDPCRGGAGRRAPALCVRGTCVSGSFFMCFALGCLGFWFRSEFYQNRPGGDRWTCSAFLHDAAGGTLCKGRIAAGVECLPCVILLKKEKIAKRRWSELKALARKMGCADTLAEGVSFRV